MRRRLECGGWGEARRQRPQPSFDVLKPAEFILSNLDLGEQPIPWCEGSRFTIKAKLKNIGERRGWVYVGWTVGTEDNCGKPLRFDNIHNFGAGEERIMTFSPEMKSGRFLIGESYSAGITGPRNQILRGEISFTEGYVYELGES